jgi:hypothetical protein
LAVQIGYVINSKVSREKYEWNMKMIHHKIKCTILHLAVTKQPREIFWYWLPLLTELNDSIWCNRHNWST